MPTFAYQARNRSGERVTGTREAPDRRAALEALRELGLFVTQLAPASSSPFRAAPAKSASPAPPLPTAPPATNTPPSFAAAPASQLQRPVEPQPSFEQAARGPASPTSREAISPTSREAMSAAQRAVAEPVGARSLGAPSPDVPLVGPSPVEKKLWARANAKEMSLFFRQMHAMLHAGTSLWHALHTLSEHGASPALRRAAREMHNHIAQGRTWSQAMRAYPGLFSELAVGMVSAGEAGGFLDRVCLKLSEYAERDYQLQQSIKRETWYPKLLVFCAILIPSAVPMVLGGFGAWLGAVMPPLLLVGVLWGFWKLLNFVMPVAAHGGSPRHWIDFLKLQIPIVGKTSRALATVKFSRALAALYSAGVGPHKAVAVAANACGNAAIAEGARRVVFDLENGIGLTDAMAKTGQFPGIALQMMRTGEESGNLDTQLDKVADFLEADAETTIKQSVKVLGIVVFLLIAIQIGMQAVQFYTGYFEKILDTTDGA